MARSSATEPDSLGPNVSTMYAEPIVGVVVRQGRGDELLGGVLVALGDLLSPGPPPGPGRRA